ncbi:spore germination protein [Bacillus sp. EAC]|uniref:spore germination protein n=1 Tax=Bacillus sp. EAC TaxID=1978338 RepID=UPI00211B620B|nr:spore germination protein [Bacillus sp. EAC]
MGFFKPKHQKINQDYMQQLQKTNIDSIEIFSSFGENVNFIKEFFNHSHDLMTYSFKLKQKECVVFYLETLVDQEKFEQKFFNPIAQSTNDKDKMDRFILDHLPKSINFAEITQKMLLGFSIILIDGEKHVFLIDTASNNERSTDEPTNEKVVRGSHLGFVESIATNLNLIRTRINNHNLFIEYLTLGEITNTKIAIVHIKGIANEEVVKEVQKRLKSISSDMVFSPGYFEEFIEDTTSSPFPQMLNTERPDRVTANLIEGRIALLVDGSPTVLILPINFFSFYQSPDDYNSRAYIGTFIRVLRLCSFILAVTLPALYIAIIGFHFEVLPEELVLTVKGAVENVPYPPLIEALIMELTIELIREAGIRLPSAIGPTIGIVGGLVIGDAIVKAGLVSNTMVVVVATTAIASYVVPSNEMSAAVRLLRFPMMMAAATFGFVGIVFGLMILVIHLCNLESFGSPYFAPIAPFRFKDLKDAIVRVPVWKMNTRPLDHKPVKVLQQSRTRKWKKNEE